MKIRNACDATNTRGLYGLCSVAFWFSLSLSSDTLAQSQVRVNVRRGSGEMDGLGRFMAYIGSFKEEDGLVGRVDKRG